MALKFYLNLHIKLADRNLLFLEEKLIIFLHLKNKFLKTFKCFNIYLSKLSLWKTFFLIKKLQKIHKIN
jgi:hypothetical protein